MQLRLQIISGQGEMALHAVAAGRGWGEGPEAEESPYRINFYCLAGVGTRVNAGVDCDEGASGTEHEVPRAGEERGGCLVLALAPRSSGPSPLPSSSPARGCCRSPPWKRPGHVRAVGSRVLAQGRPQGGGTKQGLWWAEGLPCRGPRTALRPPGEQGTLPPGCTKTNNTHPGPGLQGPWAEPHRHTDPDTQGPRVLCCPSLPGEAETLPT